MRKVAAIVVLSLMVMGLALLMTPAPALAARPAPTGPTIDVDGLPHNGVVELAVGESVTFVIHVTSPEPFNFAGVLVDQYYPGRSVFVATSPRVHKATEGTLTVTLTGKAPTDQLPDSIAPMTLAVGMRYPGGGLYAEYFDFGVVVTP